MFSRQLLTEFYRATVVPVTICSVTMSVYSRGYSDSYEFVYGKKKFTAVEYVTSLIESTLFGCCVGTTYPIGIPALAGYLYLTED
jgi:hypothetical protein